MTVYLMEKNRFFFKKNPDIIAIVINDFDAKDGMLQIYAILPG